MKKSFKQIITVIIVVMGLAVMGTSCTNSSATVVRSTVRAKVKYTYPISGNTLKVIDVDPMFEPGDVIVFAGITYTIVSIERSGYDLGEYQIFISDRQTEIWDLDRLVATIPYGKMPQLDSIFIKDNE